MPPELSAATGQVPFSRRILRELSQAFRRDARREDLSEEKAGRFEAWVLAFVSWCAGQDSEPAGQEFSASASGQAETSEGKAPEVKACRIGGFQVALRGRPECTHREAIEAMDALAFLFGAAEETKTALRSAGFSVENGSESSAGQDTSDEDTDGEGTTREGTPHQDADEPTRSRSRRVFPGWPAGETSAAGGTASGETASGETASGETSAWVAGTEESTGLGQEAISRPASHEDASSTAKAFVRAFHNQLDSVHDRASESTGGKLQGKMQGARAH